MLLNYTFKEIKMVNIMFCVFYQNFKKGKNICWPCAECWVLCQEQVYSIAWLYPQLRFGNIFINKQALDAKMFSLDLNQCEILPLKCQILLSSIFNLFKRDMWELWDYGINLYTAIIAFRSRMAAHGDVFFHIYLNFKNEDNWLMMMKSQSDLTD